MGWVLPIIMGMSWHLPSPEAVPHCPSDSARAFFPHSLMGMGWLQKILQWYGISVDIAQRGCCRREGVWACCGVGSPLSSQGSHFRQGGEKTHLLASSGSNWPYAFMHFNGDAHHVPLLKEGHLSAMTDGMPSNIPCGQICQLEVHQLLHSEAWVVYPKGLNGCLVPVITSLPKSLAHGTNVLNDEPTFLQVDLSQFMMEECESKAPFPGSDSTSTSPTCPDHGTSPQSGESSQHDHGGQWTPIAGAALDTSSQALGSSTPKRPASMALGAPSSLGLENSAKPMDTSSQASLQGKHSRWCRAGQSDPWGDLCSPFPLVETLGPGASILPGDVIQLKRRQTGH